MAHARPHPKSFTLIDSLSEILNTERDYFSRRTLHAFIDAMSGYPVGSWLRLNSKETAHVNAVNKQPI